MATVALCMIVKDEGAVIDRCLASALPLIDAWVICDTGSTDGTPDRIQAALGHLPGALHHRPWVDFGHNRTEAMRLARGAADYLLLLDADWTVHLDGELPPLEADAYTMRCEGETDFTKAGLVRGDLDWRWEGAAHEYLTVDDGYRAVDLPGFRFRNHADGAGSADRFERNRVLLEADLRVRPDDPRTTFYLGLTYRDLGRRDDAVAMFRRRVALGGWAEEVAHAGHQLGLLLLADEPEAGRAALLDAWQARPGRIEPLVDLARHHRLRDEHALAHLYARQAHETPYPTDDVLFIHRPAWAWEAAFERSVAAWWIGDRDGSLALSEALLAGGAVPPHIEPFVRLNRQFGLEHAAGHPGGAAFETADPGPAPCLLDLEPEARVTQLEVPLPAGDRAEGLSIATDGAGFVVLRRSGATALVDGEVVPTDPDGIVRTHHDRLRLDPVLDVRAIEAVDTDADTQPDRFPSPHTGLDDLRVVRVDGRWVGVTTVRDRNPDGRDEVALVTFAGDDATVVESLRLLRPPRPNRAEGRWMPFVHHDQLHLVYGLDPLVVLRVDVATGGTEVVVDELGRPVMRTWRGGTNGVALDDGHLFVVREVIVDDGGRRDLHRWVRLGPDLRPRAWSDRFTFATQPLERASGLAALGDHVVVAVGAMGEHALLVRLPLAGVREQLHHAQ